MQIALQTEGPPSSFVTCVNFYRPFLRTRALSSVDDAHAFSERGKPGEFPVYTGPVL